MGTKLVLLVVEQSPLLLLPRNPNPNPNHNHNQALSLTRNFSSSSSSSSSCSVIFSSSPRRRLIRFPVLNYSTSAQIIRASSLAAVVDSSSTASYDDDITIVAAANSDIKRMATIIPASGGSDATIITKTNISTKGNFSRLKVQKIRSLALKTAKTMRHRDDDENDNIIIEHEHQEKKQQQQKGFNVSRRESRTRPEIDRSDDEARNRNKDVASAVKPRVSSSSSSTNSLRGWDGGEGRKGNRWVRPEYGGDRHTKPQHSWKDDNNKNNNNNNNKNSSFLSKKSFTEVGCNDKMFDEFLKSQHFRRPSHIQALAFASVLGQKSCIIADQSGSGKTLAYLLPVIQRIRQEELQGLSKSLPQSPRVVILVPTAELACQVLSNCRRISKYGVPFRSIVATGGFSQKTQFESLQENLDVVIATPGRFMFLINEGLLQLSNLTCGILDEVDILLNDEDYEPALQILIKSSPVTTQYLFVTATLPTDIYNKLVEIFPDCEMIMGTGMHRTSPGLEEILVDCSGDEGTAKTPDTAFDNKKSALLKLVKDIPVGKTIIFCNKIETCRKVENVLKRVDRKSIHAKVLPFHSALAKETQLANMEEFCGPQSESSLFLVCTDRASRGIDFENVDHVVLFDYPRDPSEYVRRVGRTARGAGGKGIAFIFVVGKQVSLARRVIDRNLKGHPLHDLPCSSNYDWI